MARFFVYFNNIYFSNVKIDEQVIKSSPDLKLLGVTLDDELSFSTHISDICKMASKKVGVLVRLRNMIPREAKFAKQLMQENSVRKSTRTGITCYI